MNWFLPTARSIVHKQLNLWLLQSLSVTHSPIALQPTSMVPPLSSKRLQHSFLLDFWCGFPIISSWQSNRKVLNKTQIRCNERILLWFLFVGISWTEHKYTQINTNESLCPLSLLLLVSNDSKDLLSCFILFCYVTF